MAEFVRAQIFGTTFEITSRLVTLCDWLECLDIACKSVLQPLTRIEIDTPTCSLLAWELLDSFGTSAASPRLIANTPC